MSELMRLARGVGKRRGRYWGHFAVEVDDDEVVLALSRIDRSYQPEVLALWMELVGSPIMAEGITEFFAMDGGGGLTGGWAPLQESTVRIKAALGVRDPEGINTRTDEMFEAMITDHKVTRDPVGVEMEIPGTVDGDLREKLATAKHGKVQTAGDMMPGAYTPPRPVAVITPLEVTMLVLGLEYHIMTMASGGAALRAVTR